MSKKLPTIPHKHTGTRYAVENAIRLSKDKTARWDEPVGSQERWDTIPPKSPLPSPQPAQRPSKN